MGDIRYDILRAHLSCNNYNGSYMGEKSRSLKNVQFFIENKVCFELIIASVYRQGLFKGIIFSCLVVFF